MGNLSDSVTGLRASVADSIFELKVLHQAGVLGPIRPDKALKMGSTFVRWGASPATGIATAAIHHPHEIAVIDERGSLSFERLHRRSNALAHSFAEMGIGYGDGVGIMCRNHRGFVEATLAAAKLGASALYLNTMFAGPQLVEVTRRETPGSSSTTRSSPTCSRVSTTRWPASSAGRTRWGGWPDDPGAADRRRRRRGPEPSARQTPLRDPHLRDHRGPEGGPALQPRRAAGDRGPDRQDPLPQPRDDDDRRAAVSLLGLLPLRDEPADGVDDGAAAPFRPRGDAAGARKAAPRCWRRCR